ncbi:MAG: hypothetical protein A2W90_15845 [Bacteroidetes bacterium GWF2_42_66]|nr:MAG: hypothetical protein A2W92_08375 [Bacteroidetes bacterium GWA2_42_15]OFY02730.1 MAG: hypothetical protein A2W89_04430 [Bacteroidetes bacterium GWE2_42_39]OFY43929.1 MAG: hypothetical protein A2W90_15845 [Bacteroidetes bacterium GWF2_42_66]HBL77547.1 general stress protein CsbD [Prolixibacteraceae bacterium]HCR89980.1 general stress protein CsbD [Prolixibacteraceae bacterium]
MTQEFDMVYWNNIKMDLKKEYPQLTEADLFWRDGSKEDMLSILSIKLLKTKRELEAILEKYTSESSNY